MHTYILETFGVFIFSELKVHFRDLYKTMPSFPHILPRKRTWKSLLWKGKTSSKPSIFGFPVSFRGCKQHKLVSMLVFLGRLAVSNSMTSRRRWIHRWANGGAWGSGFVVFMNGYVKVVIPIWWANPVMSTYELRRSVVCAFFWGEGFIFEFSTLLPFDLLIVPFHEFCFCRVLGAGSFVYVSFWV